MNDEQLINMLRSVDRSVVPATVAPAELAKRVRRRRQQRDRRRRCAAIGAALIGTYLLGFGTAWAWNWWSHGTPESTLVTQQAQTAEARADSELSESTAAQRPRTWDDSATQLAQQPVVPPRVSSYERFRRLGDEYLDERGDVVTALEFYRRALDEASPGEFAISDERDSWLLKSLKRDRLASSATDVSGGAI